jgi:hypothetical protein
MNDIPEHLKGVETAELASEDQLDRARRLSREYWEIEQNIENIEKMLSDAKSRKKELTEREIPEHFASCGIDTIGLADAGEHGVDIIVGPYCHANIPKSWPVEQQERGFEVLEELDGGDLIRVVVSVSFFKEELDDAKELVEFLRTEWPKANEHPAVMDKSVPWNSLTSFLKAYIRDETTDPLTDEQKEALGATIGTVARIKPRKEK